MEINNQNKKIVDVAHIGFIIIIIIIIIITKMIYFKICGYGSHWIFYYYYYYYKFCFFLSLDV